MTRWWHWSETHFNACLRTKVDTRISKQATGQRVATKCCPQADALIQYSLDAMGESNSVAGRCQTFGDLFGTLRGTQLRKTQPCGGSSRTNRAIRLQG